MLPSLEISPLTADDAGFTQLMESSPNIAVAVVLVMISNLTVDGQQPGHPTPCRPAGIPRCNVVALDRSDVGYQPRSAVSMTAASHNPSPSATVVRRLRHLLTADR